MPRPRKFPRISSEDLWKKILRKPKLYEVGMASAKVLEEIVCLTICAVLEGATRQVGRSTRMMKRKGKENQNKLASPYSREMHAPRGSVINFRRCKPMQC
mmetsp:Transcript_2786/g.6304  ORF Transcript_2786/g.6304 Transcript_2786/m.6304 type:complete len:100 (-) Transcript_2786:16-315(-)